MFPIASNWTHPGQCKSLSSNWGSAMWPTKGFPATLNDWKDKEPFFLTAFRRDQPSQYLDLELLASKIVRQQISLMSFTQSVVLCYDSPGTLHTIFTYTRIPQNIHGTPVEGPQQDFISWTYSNALTAVIQKQKKMTVSKHYSKSFAFLNHSILPITPAATGN